MTFQYPVIDPKASGKQIRTLCAARGLSPKEIQQQLTLTRLHIFTPLELLLLISCPPYDNPLMISSPLTPILDSAFDAMPTTANTIAIKIVAAAAA